MAGSFDVFRKYQRSLLVAVAILAMLAFFVLPPFLQMGGSGPSGDPVAARWSGGEIREGQLERSVAMRSVVNRFLVEAAVAAGRDPARLPLFPESEEAVVRTMLVNEEARTNGLVVSDTAINDFLAQWTNNLVRPEQLAEIIGGLRLGPTAVSQHDLFEALRAELTGRNMLFMFQTGFSGDPPGWRWDYYKRLEQKATVEVVAVPVESVVADVPVPTESTLRAFFERYKDDLPDPRSDAPGFRKPRRARYEYFVAKREAFEAAAAKDVTDEEIAAFYEKNKATMFRAAAAAKADGAAAQKAGDKDAAKPDGNDKPDQQKEATAPKDADGKEAKPAAAPQGAIGPRRPMQTVAFRQPAESKPAGKPADEPAQPAPDAEPASETALDFEPLDAVKDKIREQLAREKANARIDAIFSAIAGDIGRYAEDVALWKARGGDAAPPAPPDIDLIATKQSLEAGRSDLVTAEQAVASGGIGRSFEFVADPGSRFGIRQQNWLDSIFGENTMPLRPVTSRDVAGTRYLSWKTEDQAEFTPTFDDARDDVEFSWRIVEGRGLARKKAEELAARVRAEKQSFEMLLGGNTALKATKSAPFTWLSTGANGQTVLSQPDAVQMPGEEFMEAVFGLEPEQTAVAFNEPRTVCYAIRLESLEPPATELREKFLESKSDPRRIGAVAQGEFSRSFGDWLVGLEKRYGLTWTRQPRR
ncbi:MAG: hypothetical protein WCR51_06870 [Planctomycetia bacterium]